MARVTRRPLAEADILDIWSFIAEDSIDQADRWVEALDEILSLWARQPLMGRERDELMPGLRSFPFGRYVVFYATWTDGIDVVRVLHSSRDLNSGLNG